MSVKVTVRQLQEQLPELLDRAVKSGEEYIVQHHGKAVAVLVSLRQWRRIKDDTHTAAVKERERCIRAYQKKMKQLGPDYWLPPEQQEHAPKQMADILFMYGAPTLVLLLGGGWLLLRRTLAPLTDLAATAERIHSGNLRERLPRSGDGDELDRLAAVLNAMLARLEDSFSHIQEFTLHASHELKTPLTLMRGEVENLLALDAGTPDERERLAGHLEEIQRLARIVDNLALLAKADAGLAPLRREEVPLHELVREAFDDANVLGESLRLQVALRACDEIRLRGDRERLRQMLLNLVDNAAKYNEPDGRIVLELRREDQHARRTIANTGPGIPAAELSRVGDRFHRGEQARRLHRDGSGLGLSTGGWVVEAHGGQLDVTSDPGGLTTVNGNFPWGSPSGRAPDSPAAPG